jgi:hypothetical protein
MRRRSTMILLCLAVVGLAIAACWQLTTYMPAKHEALRYLEVPLFLGAAVVFMAGLTKLYPFYRRLHWTPWGFFRVAHRHHADWLAGLCLLTFLYAIYGTTSFGGLFVCAYSVAILALYIAHKEEQSVS